jgi:hypothetical protein
MRPLPLSVLNRHFSKISKNFISSSHVDLLGADRPPADLGSTPREVSKKQSCFPAITVRKADQPCV